MLSLVRKTLEIYLQEWRIITQTEFPPESLIYLEKKDPIFVTLYHAWRVIASSGRVACQKENSLFEAIDNTLLCLKDERFLKNLQTQELLTQIYIRIDIAPTGQRRILQNIADMDISSEWIIFFSESLWVMSVVLPHMLHVSPNAQTFFELACKKAGHDPKTINPADYVLYAIKTQEFTDMI